MERFPIRSQSLHFRMLIPWEMIAPYEDQALRNHSQPLKRLAERGGLTPREALCILDRMDWFRSPWKDRMEQDALMELWKRVDAWTQLQTDIKVNQAKSALQQSWTASIEIKAIMEAERKRRIEAEALLAEASKLIDDEWLSGDRDLHGDKLPTRIRAFLAPPSIKTD